MTKKERLLRTKQHKDKSPSAVATKKTFATAAAVANGDAVFAENVSAPLEGSFSAVSTPSFATKYSFCSVFQDLQNELAEFATCLQFFSNFANSAKLLVKFSDFCKIFLDFRFFSEFSCQILKIQLAHFVDLERCCKMSTWTQKSTSIQKRTSPLKFDDSAKKSEKSSVSNLSTKTGAAAYFFCSA